MTLLIAGGLVDVLVSGKWRGGSYMASCKSCVEKGWVHKFYLHRKRSYNVVDWRSGDL